MMNQKIALISTFLCCLQASLSAVTIDQRKEPINCLPEAKFSVSDPTYREEIRTFSEGDSLIQSILKQMAQRSYEIRGETRFSIKNPNLCIVLGRGDHGFSFQKSYTQTSEIDLDDSACWVKVDLNYSNPTSSEEKAGTDGSLQFNALLSLGGATSEQAIELFKKQLAISLGFQLAYAAQSELKDPLSDKVIGEALMQLAQTRYEAALKSRAGYIWNTDVVDQIKEVIGLNQKAYEERRMTTASYEIYKVCDYCRKNGIELGQDYGAAFQAKWLKLAAEKKIEDAVLVKGLTAYEEAEAKAQLRQAGLAAGSAKEGEGEGAAELPSAESIKALKQEALNCLFPFADKEGPRCLDVKYALGRILIDGDIQLGQGQENTAITLLESVIFTQLNSVKRGRAAFDLAQKKMQDESPFEQKIGMVYLYLASGFGHEKASAQWNELRKSAGSDFQDVYNQLPGGLSIALLGYEASLEKLISGFKAAAAKALTDQVKNAQAASSGNAASEETGAVVTDKATTQEATERESESCGGILGAAIHGQPTLYAEVSAQQSSVSQLEKTFDDNNNHEAQDGSGETKDGQPEDANVLYARL